MGGYFDRGASTGGSNESYFSRDQTGATDSINTSEGPPGVTKDDITYDPDNPNIARATNTTEPKLDETAGTTSQARMQGTYPDIIEGSDSEQTGTSWGVPGVEDAAEVEIGNRIVGEGTEEGEAHPNRNTGARLSHDDLQDVGSWSTIDKGDSAGSPTGNI